MPGAITDLLGADHARLDALLRKAIVAPGRFDREAFDAFRAGLLRHIALEEKILFPAARAARGGEPLPLMRRLRIDHGALGSLLVPTPDADLVAEIRSILDPHNAAEDGPGGLYETCDALLAPQAAGIVVRLRAYPAVKVRPYNDGPRTLRRAADALALSAKQFDPR